jgi:hypothetical protein
VQLIKKRAGVLSASHEGNDSSTRVSQIQPKLTFSVLNRLSIAMKRVWELLVCFVEASQRSPRTQMSSIQLNSTSKGLKYIISLFLSLKGNLQSVQRLMLLKVKFSYSKPGIPVRVNVDRLTEIIKCDAFLVHSL